MRLAVILLNIKGMNTLSIAHLQKLAQTSQSAFRSRDLDGLISVQKQIQLPHLDVEGRSLIRILTEARLLFLQGNGQQIQIETLKQELLYHPMCPDKGAYFLNEVIAETWQFLSTLYLHQGDFHHAGECLDLAKETFEKMKQQNKALELELHKLHLFSVFVPWPSLKEQMIQFEALLQKARSYGCKSVELSTALFISKEYLREKNLIKALHWIEHVICGYLFTESNHPALEIAFLQRADIFHRMGLQAAYLMDLEASRMIKGSVH